MRMMLWMLLPVAYAVSANAQSMSCRQVYSGASAYPVYSQYRVDAVQAKSEAGMQKLSQTNPIYLSHGTNVPLVRALEKEGLFYADIVQWFPTPKANVKDKLRKRLEQETTNKIESKTLTQVLSKLQRLVGQSVPGWKSLTVEQRLEIILDRENIFDVLPMTTKELLFDMRVLTFDDIGNGPNTPKALTVGDDIGSYEIRTDGGLYKHGEFFNQRAIVEKHLDSKIGHQHLFHAWPKDDQARREMAPQYIETLDSSAWYLFWRQMNRNPEDVESLLTHPYLGLYTRSSLGRLHKAVDDNQPAKFKDKFRMVGARAFKSSAAIPGQKEHAEHTPDWELRSGNKTENRDFVEATLLSRINTGDYSGMRDYRSYDFDPSAPLRELVEPFLNAEQTQIMMRFEKNFKYLKYSDSPIAKNHYRNKFLSPLFAWTNRLNIPMKEAQIKAAQREYTMGLLAVARKYLKDRAATRDQYERLDITQEAVDKIEVLVYEFAKKARLDKDFEKYLKVAPARLPEVYIQPTGPIDVNSMRTGIEYSFRFPTYPESRDQANKMIYDLTNSLVTNFNGSDIQYKGSDPAHGHGVAVKYIFKDTNQKTWRVEWDGIQRQYRNGKVISPWGGHVEIPTPAITAREAADAAKVLYATGANLGFFPSRKAGGAHFNFDLEGLQKQGPAGVQAVQNLILNFESQSPMVLALWTFPGRFRAAYSKEMSADFMNKLANFKGNWEQLGRFLYENRYFNSFVGRKPKYVPLNLTAMMTDYVPTDYVEKSLDIRNKEQEWFPNFAKVHGRGEARFFDAPSDVYTAHLQLKYWLAFMNQSFNHQGSIRPERKYSYDDIQAWVADPNVFIEQASKHLESLGLDVAEFTPLLWESYNNLKSGIDREMPDYVEYQNFLPAKENNN